MGGGNRRRVARAVALVVAIPLLLVPSQASASSHRRGSARPVLGDWEGTGPEGLPISFTLVRVHGRIAIRDVTIGNPLRCPGRFAPTDAIGYAQASYSGPGAPPLVRLGWRPDEIHIRTGVPFFSPEWSGRLVNPRLAILSEPAPTGLPAGCGWPIRKLTWHVKPAHRAPVKPGVWSGTVAVPGGGGTVSVKVSASGRVVEDFSASITCEAGGGGFEVGPAAVGEFISATGSFEDADRPSGFNGRFLSGTLTGTITGRRAGCGESALPFTATSP